MSDSSSPESPTARGLDRRALDYSASIAFDRRLYAHDIDASIAHARMLAKQGIVPGDDAEAIARGLEEIRAEIERDEFPFHQELEDIHLNIEARLKEKLGEAAGRLHTARSRNDQIATDMRLYVMEACDLPSGTAYPALRRLERAGLLKSRWEKAAEAYADGRPRRRTYELTPSGLDALPEAERKLSEVRRLLGDLPPASTGKA